MGKYSEKQVEEFHPVVMEFADRLEKMNAGGDDSDLEDGMVALARLLENMPDDIPSRLTSELERIGAIMMRTTKRTFLSNEKEESKTPAKAIRVAKPPDRPSVIFGCNCNCDTILSKCCLN